MLKEQLLKLSNYNFWANEKICGFILEAGEEKADQVQASSFSTIRKTMYHIYDAELIWQKRLQGETLLSWPPSKHFKGPLSADFLEVLLNSKQLADFINNATVESLLDNFSYTNTSNVAFVSKKCDALMHCLNHSTYHRGQLITMLRGAGFTHVSSTDFISYCRFLEE